MYSRSKLEKLLRQAKVTTQSIQKVSQWILTHRQHLLEIVAQWADLIREREAEHQIVYFYVANDAMQVGGRKFGRHIAAAFEEKLVDIVHFVMTEGEEKVKRCIIKIVGIWKERGVVTPSLLAMLENVCAGKPAVEVMPEADMNPEETTARLLREMTSEAAVERVLEEMPEVVEAAATTQLAAHLQDLVNATISADMLSDRMFQLESSLSVFHHACAAQDEEAVDDEVVVVGEEERQTYPAAGGVAWSKMDQQVYDLDVDSSRTHVEQYRGNLTDQVAKREALIKKLQSLEDTDLFAFPRGAIAIEEAELQEQALERLYGVACEAETVEMKQLEAQRAEFRARQASLAASIADPLYTGHQTAEDSYRPITPTAVISARDSGNGHVSYRRSSYQYDEPQQHPPVLRRHSSVSAATDRSFNDRYNNQQRHEGQLDQYGGQRDRYGEHSGRYGVDSPSASKRPKLHHSHSMESQNLQWQEASRRSPPRAGTVPNPYAAVDRQQLPYSPRDTIYSPRDQYHAPAPQPRQSRRTRWNPVPDDRSKVHYNEPRW